MQSYGAKRSPRKAVMRGGVYLTLGVAVAFVGKALYDSEVGEEYVQPVLEKMWNETVAKIESGEVKGGIEKILQGAKGYLTMGVTELMDRF